MWWRISLLAAAWVAWAGPVEFGLEEYRRALQERGLKPELYRVRTELNAEPPETYRIAPGLITGGDLRGLMYGLLDAAEQIRRRGRVWAAHGRPATPIRGIRWFLHNRELEEEWFYSKQHWLDLFSFLARCRFNRFNLVYAHQTNYQAPPYPFWLALDDYPEIRAPGLAALEQQRHLEMLRFISQAAADHGIDFTLGIWQHNVQANQMPTVVGLTPKNIGPYSYAALRRILAECPAIRSVQMRTNVESGIPREDQVGFYRDWVFRALREAGRRVTLDLRAWALAQGMIEAAHSVGVPLRVSTKYWAEHLGRPYQPAETFPGYSYLDLLRKPRHYEFFWEVWALGSHRLLVWGDPEYVRRAVPTFTLSGTAGFEIDPPLAQKGFGNRPGKWGVFTPAHRDKIWWKWEFERYWLFYLLWGRLSYDPRTAETVWLDEFQRRFGAAARDALEVYRAASGVLNEIVAVHMADPNMYIWPEVNPGGLIDAYIEVRPSDWRFVAAIPEAVENRLKGVASAKQTPLETAARLRQMATRIEQGIANVRARGVPSREWVATEPDFRVLAHLARYHAHKQVAAYELAWHYRVGDGAALKRARSELEAAQSVWEDLVRLTDGLYPEEMAFGPQDIGHWKDRLPYVRHDVQTVAERERVWEELGRFDFGFDFGAEPQAPATGAIYRRDPYLWRHTVEPRFQAVGPDTMFSAERGYGWVGGGERKAHALPLTPYVEIRSAVKDPRQLPANVLYGDWLEGRGAQTFRVRTGDGRFRVSVLTPEGRGWERLLEAREGHLDVVFPEGPWRASGLVVWRDPPAPALTLPVAPKPGPRPMVFHIPPRMATPGQALRLTLRISPASASFVTRLYYRPLNQLAKFKVSEARGAQPVFVIPGEEVVADWDLLYYFEILAREGGWFYPDPQTATPYIVVPVQTGEAAQAAGTANSASGSAKKFVP
jgi:hypothetical protein